MTPVNTGFKPNRLWMTRQVYDEVMHLCLRRRPEEACGLLGGQRGIASSHYPIPNVAEQPTREFLMEPRAQIEAFRRMEEAGEGLIAIYHSHPDTSPIPSRQDIHQAYYPDVFYLIIGVAAHRRGGRAERFPWSTRAHWRPAVEEDFPMEMRAFRIHRQSGQVVGVDWSLMNEKNGARGSFHQ